MLPVLPPADVDQLRKLIPAYQAGLQPTADDVIASMFGSLATAYPSHKISPAEAKAKLKLYVRGLRDIPHDALAKAFEAVLKACTFFPSIAEIREAASKHFEPRRLAITACKRLIAKHEREWEPEKVEEPMRPEDVPEANRLMKRIGARTRYREDGTAFQLQPGEVDPCQPEPEPAEAAPAK